MLVVELCVLFLLLCDFSCSVSLPHSAMGWSVVSECAISWSYSFAVLFYMPI